MTRSLEQGGTITLESLDETSSSVDRTNSSFVFNGTNSDIARQLYIRHNAGDSGDQVELTSVPPAVIKRLDPLNIDFASLPGLVQRAVLWDTGFAIAAGNLPVQIYPKKDRTMASINVQMYEVFNVQCKTTNCTQPNGEQTYYSFTCTGYQMLNTSHCVIDVFNDTGSTNYLGNMWAAGGDPDLVPEIELRDHTWTENIAVFGGDTFFSVYVVHTVASRDEAPWGECLPKGYGSPLSVPCHRRDQFSDEYMAANTTVPEGSAWVTTWLEQEFAEDSGFNKLMLLPILLGVFVAIGVAWFYRGRRTKLQEKLLPSTSTNLTGSRLGDTTHGSALTPIDMDSLILHGVSISSLDYESAGSSKALQILLGSDHLHGKRIPYELLVFENALSKGASGETMTGGIGTPYWIAPEVLEGEHYTEQADIYSFGVVLSELDTGKIPYHDAVTEDGTKLKPFRILNEVMSGTLRPSFAGDCPARIQRISTACLSLDPSSRPTAQELVDELEGRQKN
ncbi:hypothetical protein PRIC1_010518 [Phytophthora ramorum]